MLQKKTWKEQSAAARDEEYGKDGINDGVDENNIYGTMPVFIYDNIITITVI